MTLGAHCVALENGAGTALIWKSLTTLKLLAATPPKVTFFVPAKPDPRIVTGVGEVSGPPYGLMPVTDGSADEAVSSTYCSVLAAPGALDSPFLTVTTTGAGPDPSCGLGDPGGSVFAAGGNVAVIDVLLLTVKSAGPISASPTWIPATSGPEAFSKPDPVIVTLPPAVESTAGASPVTPGLAAF